MKFTYTLLTLVLCCFTLSAQSSFKISGFVMNEDRMPIEAVSISVVGNNNTIQSDQNGFFELTLSTSGTITLHIDALGYFPLSTQLKVNSSIRRDFILRKNNIELEEVIVSGNNKRSLHMKSAQNLVQVDKSYIEDNFSGYRRIDPCIKVCGVMTDKVNSTSICANPHIVERILVYTAYCRIRKPPVTIIV